MVTGASVLLETPRGTPETPIRILTVDEHALVRDGLAAVLDREPDMQVVAGAATGVEAVKLFRQLRPDVVTVDLFLPDMPGEEAASRILAEFPTARVVLIAGTRGDLQIQRALQTGVRGLVLKGMTHRELVDTIQQVHTGRKVIPRQVASTLAEHIGERALTPREVQVLQLVAQGNRNKQVAAKLSIADETVRMHMKNILGKLTANDRTHAVTIAVTRGVFQL